MKKNIFAILLIHSIVFIICGCNKTGSLRAIPIQSVTIFSEIKHLLPNIKQLSTSALNIENISGYYCTSGSSMKEQMGGALSGAELYLFPDNTYIYLRWADIFPLTIYEKGQWNIHNGFIVLDNDGSVSQNEFPKDNEYLPLVIHKGNKDNIFIMGSKRDYSYFLKEAKDDSAFMLLLCGFEKEKTIAHIETKDIKKKLMEKAWKPWLFAEGYPPHTLKVEAYKGSDIVAIIKTISGHQIPLDKGGGIKIKAKVIYSIKGAKSGDELDIFYAAGNLQQEYIANLVWEPNLNGYKYYDWNMDIPVIDIEKSEYSSIYEFMKGWGLEGEPVLIESNRYYLPVCRTECDDICQRKFEYIQYMLKQNSNH